jgi:mannose-6-phosphate isomerase-like protein (cupin superfamily)
MPAKTLEHPTSGDRLIVLVGTEESRGELFRFEYVARVAALSPPDHVHHQQEERIEVLEGTISCRIAGKEVVLGPGETLTIPRGVHHAVWSSDPAGSRSIGEFRPALNSEKIFERYFS